MTEKKKQNTRRNKDPKTSKRPWPTAEWGTTIKTNTLQPETTKKRDKKKKKKVEKEKDRM